MADQQVAPFDDATPRPGGLQLRCRVGWHRWSTWSRPIRHLVSYARQGRVCLDCGAAGVRIFKAGE